MIKKILKQIAIELLLKWLQKLGQQPTQTLIAEQPKKVTRKRSVKKEHTEEHQETLFNNQVNK